MASVHVRQQRIHQASERGKGSSSSAKTVYFDCMARGGRQAAEVVSWPGDRAKKFAACKRKIRFEVSRKEKNTDKILPCISLR